MIPIGDYPNPRSPQWVTRILVGLNVAIYLFITMPLDRRLDSRDLADPAIRKQIEEIVRTWARSEGSEPAPGDVAAVAQSLTRYDLVVLRYGYRPGRPDVLALFTCMFLHANFLHVFGNMLMLWIFGDNVEARLGRTFYLVAYLATGIVGTLSFALLKPSSLTPVVGASGAIFGVLGFYLVWFPRNQIRVLILFYFMYFVHVRAVWVLLVFVVYNNVLPLLLERRMGGGGVAHGAHIGGFAAGMVGALLFDMFRGRPPRGQSLPYVERRRAPWSRPRPVAGAAGDAFHAAVQMGRMEEAAHSFTRHVTDGGAPPKAADVFALGRWLYDNGFAPDAAAVFRYYLANYPREEDLDRVHLGLGVLLARRLGEPAAAREHLLSAIDLARDPSVAAKAREELAALG